VRRSGLWQIGQAIGSGESGFFSFIKIYCRVLSQVALSRFEHLRSVIVNRSSPRARPAFACRLALDPFIVKRKQCVCPVATAIAPGFRKNASARCCAVSASRSSSRQVVRRRRRRPTRPKTARREADAARRRSCGADHVPLLPIDDHHHDERQGGCLVVLAVWNVRTGVERRTAPPGEPPGPWRTLDMSRGHRKGRPG
jgi:hypothetical protein